MRKSTDADDLQSSIKKKQQLADDRRQNELVSREKSIAPLPYFTSSGWVGGGRGVS